MHYKPFIERVKKNQADFNFFVAVTVLPVKIQDNCLLRYKRREDAETAEGKAKIQGCTSCSHLRFPQLLQPVS